MSGASDCRSDEGVIVGLIDGMIASARVVSRWLRENVAPSEQVSEALKDIRADEDIALVVRTMLAAAATAPLQAARRERDEAVREAKHQKRLLNEAWREVWRAVHDRNDAPEWWDLSPSDLICAVQDMHRPDDCPADALSARLRAVRDLLDEAERRWAGVPAVINVDEVRALLGASLGTPGDEKPQPSEPPSPGCDHRFRFDGDDPYLICERCNQLQDALTGRVLRAGSPSGSSGSTE